MSFKKKGWQKLSDYLKFQNRYYLKGKSLKRKEIHLSIRSNIQYWENCWRSRSITFLPRQCVQENVAADVHNTFHFNQASSHSCGRVACQEDNTMAEREKYRVGARHVLGWVGGWYLWRSMVCCQLCFIKFAGWAMNKTTICKQSFYSLWLHESQQFRIHEKKNW